MTVAGIGIDWGSTHVRAWCLSETGEALATEKRDFSFMDVSGGCVADFVKQLLAALGSDEGTPIIACGMIGAKGGWAEVPYVNVPAGPQTLMEGLMKAPRPDTWIAPGVCIKTDCPDVMRGEETQVMGVLARHKIEGQALICLPGTHSKWVSVSDGRIESFRTFATGELHALSTSQSIYGKLTKPGEFHEPSFLLGLEVSDDRATLNHLFQARSRVLTGSLSELEAYWFLSGVLIGSEIRSVTPNEQDVFLVADGALQDIYAIAMRELKIRATAISAEDATRHGLAALLHKLKQCN